MRRFIQGDERALLTGAAYSPVTMAFVIVQSDRGYMMLYNKYRHVWELTGGMIEPGETAAQCAIRECREESGQRLPTVDFLGLAELFMKKNAYRGQDSLEYAALYYAYLDTVHAFAENDEIQRLAWIRIDALDTIPDLCATSRKMLTMHAQAGVGQSHADLFQIHPKERTT